MALYQGTRPSGANIRRLNFSWAHEAIKTGTTLESWDRSSVLAQTLNEQDTASLEFQSLLHERRAITFLMLWRPTA
jgi:hypothetical protein